MSKSFIFFLHAENFGLRKPCSSEIVPNPIRNVHSGAKSMQRLGERERACVYFYISLPLISFFLSPVPSLFVIPFARAFFFFPRAPQWSLSTCDASATKVAHGARCQRQKLLKEELVSIIVPAVCSLNPARDFSAGSPGTRTPSVVSGCHIWSL